MYSIANGHGRFESKWLGGLSELVEVMNDISGCIELKIVGDGMVDGSILKDFCYST